MFFGSTDKPLSGRQLSLFGLFLPPKRTCKIFYEQKNPYSRSFTCLLKKYIYHIGYLVRMLEFLALLKLQKG